MKPLIRGICYTSGGIIAILLLLFCTVWLTEWRPGEQEVLYSGPAERLADDTLTLLSWNTGYAGLGGDMDFFYDGGKQMRTSRERTEENLRQIVAFLAGHPADFILLQEVDLDSRRSYGIDQFVYYQKALPEYELFYADNYRSPFVPIPLRSPMGKVRSGVALLSKVKPGKVIRYQYPSSFAFPVRLFNLKRGLLSARFQTQSGSPVWINVTHNTAFDTGGMRTEEMVFLRELLLSEYQQGTRSITGGDWNQNPPGYNPSPAEVENAYFSVIGIDSTFFPPGWSFAFDPENSSVRYLYEPLRSETTRSVVDFFIASPGIRVIGTETHDLEFCHSDHNPVTATFVVE